MFFDQNCGRLGMWRNYSSAEVCSTSYFWKLRLGLPWPRITLWEHSKICSTSLSNHTGPKLPICFLTKIAEDWECGEITLRQKIYLLYELISKNWSHITPSFTHVNTYFRDFGDWIVHIDAVLIFPGWLSLEISKFFIDFAEVQNYHWK